MAQLLDYTGARSRLSPERGLDLDARRWAWMPKVDGCYARITTDRSGRVASIIGRNGRPIGDARDLLNIRVGAVNAVLHGELEAHTEAGIRAAATRGWAALHLFDATRIHGASIESLPYEDRYGWLHRAQAALECAKQHRAEPMQPDRRTFVWGLPGAPQKQRRWSRGMVPGGPPRDLRRFPIVPMARGAGAGATLWREFVDVGGGEGLVAVRLDAPVRARSAKRKIKATDTLDCRVVNVEPKHARLEYGGHTFVVSAAGRLRPAVGQVVSVAVDGWYEASVTPRFARIVSIRTDLA